MQPNHSHPLTSNTERRTDGRTEPLVEILGLRKYIENDIIHSFHQGGDSNRVMINESLLRMEQKTDEKKGTTVFMAF